MSPTGRSVLIATVVILVLVFFSVTYYAKIGPLFYLNSTSITTSESSQSSFNSTFSWNYNFLVLVNYSGSWRLVYWGGNGNATPTENNARGNLSGSGNYGITITLQGVGYVERTLCANATKLDSHNNLTLTLSVSGQSNRTTSSNPSAEVCATVAP